MTGRNQRGSVLLLFPAGFLVVLVLAAVAIDSSIAFLGERELSSAVTAAANDAATKALSDNAFYGRGAVELSDAEVSRVAEERVRAAVDTTRYAGLRVNATVTRPAGPGCRWTLHVEASATVRYLFAPVVPGGPDEARVDASATSHPVREGTTC